MSRFKKQQETIEIINPSRSVSPDKQFKAKIYKTLWEKREDKLRSQGWIPMEDIKEIKVEKVEDGKGIKTVETVVDDTPEATPEVAPEAKKKSIGKMTKAELMEELDGKGIVYHEDSTKAKLIELLKGE